MADWYVYQHDGDPLGPWSTDAVAEAILVGKLPPDVWVAAPGGPRWLRALDVPVIGRMVEGIPTRPRRESGLRFIPLPPESAAISHEPPTTRSAGDTAAGRAGDTAPMPAISLVPATDFFGAWKNDYDIAQAVATADAAGGAVEPDPSTDPSLPPSSTPSPPPGARREIAASDTDRRRRRKGA